MKRGTPLQRRTPLKAKKPMNRGTTALRQQRTPLKRTTPEQAPARNAPSPKPRARKTPTASEDERATRRIVEERSDGFCEKCGAPPATDKAHRISRGVGGWWDPANILDLCRTCHQYDHAHPTTAYDGGWHLRSGTIPEDAPVWFHHEGTFGWAYLHHDGTYTWASKDNE